VLIGLLALLAGCKSPSRPVQWSAPEPFLPKALLVLVGHGPVIETLATLGESTGYAVTVTQLRGDSLGAVLGTHG